MEPSVLLVEALYSFKGTNNDELRFKKGAVITVTQNDDETWWEGTLDGNTGWFPSNYVQPYHPAESKEMASQQTPAVEQQMFRALVLRNLLDSELQHISELKQLLTDCLRPLTNMKHLSSSAFTSLVGHLEHITNMHEELLSRLEHEGGKPSADQRVGGVFLAMAAEQLSFAHKEYCSQHPRAVCFLQEHQAEISRFIESTPLCADSSEGARKKPGLLVLTTGMSKPFRRLQQYSGQLQELHRHLPEAHKDRGDALRAAKVMADLSSSCQAMRRQKELELEVVTRELVGWNRGTLSVLGEVVAMGSVAVLPDHTDRYLIVFPKHLVVLGVSANMSNFIFQSEHNLSDITCRKLEDCEQYKNAFELTGAKMERMIAVCQSKSDQQQWVTRLTQQPVAPKPSSATASSQPQLPPRKPNFGKRPVDVNPQQPQPPPPLPPSHGRGSEATAAPGRQSAVPQKLWCFSDLRPAPPLRPQQLKRARNLKKDERWHDEDNAILRVVEAYCASAVSRYAPGDGIGTRPADIAADASVNDDRSLMEVVQQLQSQLSRLSEDHRLLKHQFEREKSSNDYLRSVVQKTMVPSSPK